MHAAAAAGHAPAYAHPAPTARTAATAHAHRAHHCAHQQRFRLQKRASPHHSTRPRARTPPRTPRTAWPCSRWAKAEAVLAFVRERGVVHPREVDEHFAHGSVRNWFGGSARASTELLDGMHYRGLLRVARRDAVALWRRPVPRSDVPPALVVKGGRIAPVGTTVAALRPQLLRMVGVAVGARHVAGQTARMVHQVGKGGRATLPAHWLATVRCHR